MPFKNVWANVAAAVGGTVVIGYVGKKLYNWLRSDDKKTTTTTKKTTKTDEDKPNISMAV